MMDRLASRTMHEESECIFSLEKKTKKGFHFRSGAPNNTATTRMHPPTHSTKHTFSDHDDSSKQNKRTQQITTSQKQSTQSTDDSNTEMLSLKVNCGSTSTSSSWLGLSQSQQQHRMKRNEICICICIVHKYATAAGLSNEASKS